MDSQDTQSKAPETPKYFSRSTTLVDSPSSLVTVTDASRPANHYWRLASAFLCFFVIGWGDGATGAVLPEIQSHFQLNFVMGSMLFMTGSAGYAFATFFVEPLSRRFGRFHLSAERRSWFPALGDSDSVAYSPSKGRHLSLLMAGILHCVYFLVTACSPQYYGVLFAFFIGGIGKSILIAQINVYWTTNPRLIGISLLHGTYGVGAFFSPLISQIMHAHGYEWRKFFWISVGLAVLNVSFILCAFHTIEKEFEMEKGLAIASETLSQAKLAAKTDIENVPQTSGEATESQQGMWHIFRMPYVWTIASFLGLYQGAETIAQGFIVTFLLHERNASPNTVGYAASGFWGGLAIGRSTWGFLSPYFSQKVKIHYVNCVLVLGMVFHVLIWKIDNINANSIVVSLLGLIVGPTFPLVLDIATNQKTKQAPGTPSPLPVFSADVQLTALAIGSSVGALGGAIFPLAAGIAATKYGAYVVEPLAMATLGFVLVFWLGAQIVSKIVRK